MGLKAALGSGPVAVDSAIFIYFIEEHPAYLHLIRPLFASAAEGMKELVTSAITLLEVLVVPYRAGDTALAERYEALLSHSQGLRLVPLDHVQMHAAARIRAALRLRTPDALQVAAAVTSRCSAFLTNDRGVRAVPGTHVVQLADHEEY